MSWTRTTFAAVTRLERKASAVDKEAAASTGKSGEKKKIVFQFHAGSTSFILERALEADGQSFYLTPPLRHVSLPPRSFFSSDAAAFARAQKGSLLSSAARKDHVCGAARITRSSLGLRVYPLHYISTATPTTPRGLIRSSSAGTQL